MSQPLRVFIVEDDDTTRACLREALEGEPGFVVAGVASSLEEGRGAASVPGVDVVIVDLALGEQSGIELIRELRDSLPEAELMAHTVFDDRESVFRALKAGASSYLLKGCSTEELCGAIRSLRDGGAPMSPRIARMVIEDLQVPAPDPITPRERQILRAIDQGLTYKEIAAELAISVHTVHSHIKSVYERLHANGKRDALARARQRGLL